MLTAKKIETDVLSMGDAEIASHSQRFFKAGIDEYGVCRYSCGKSAKTGGSIQASSTGLDILQQSLYHEIRLLAVFHLMQKYQLAKMESKRKALVDLKGDISTRQNGVRHLP